jgi:hypothetical protein
MEWRQQIRGWKTASCSLVGTKRCIPNIYENRNTWLSSIYNIHPYGNNKSIAYTILLFGHQQIYWLAKDITMHLFHNLPPSHGIYRAADNAIPFEFMLVSLPVKKTIPVGRGGP